MEIVGDKYICKKISSLFKIFSQPFPRPENTIFQKILNSFYEGVGVFFFFYVFQPFGINGWDIEHKNLYLAIYGVLVFLVTAFYRVILPVLFSQYFSEKNWTVGREILGIVFILAMITGLILFYHSVIFHNSGGRFQEVIFMFFLVTVIGSIPVTISVLSRFTFLYKKYNQEIRLSSVSPQSKVLRLIADNEKDFLEIEDLLYIESADNYSSILFKKEGKREKELLRSSLSRLETQIENPRVVRCHRSYIVNLDHVVSVSGNAQGYKLHLRDLVDTIPVARKYSYLVDKIRL